ncbi:MAG: efflux RND transporter periplasmic adaptor subunit [Candidatus Binatia bacterium]
MASILFVVVACGRNRYAPPPPPEVTVTRPVEREITTYNEFTGHTVAIEAVDVRARVAGVLEKMHFAPGANVKKGDLLFVIEPALYQARVDQAQADLDGKEAQYRAAEEQFKITQAIVEGKAGSRTDFVQKTQARDLAKAQVAMARANLEAARLDLSYTRIYAPIDGRIDRNLVDVGNLVGAGQATLLASIVREDPIYVYFTASERELLQYREQQRQNRSAAPAGQNDFALLGLATDENLAFLGLATETGYPHAGKIDYSANRVDPETGTFEARALFPNPDRVILAGLFARVRVPFSRERAILVPDIAVQADQGGSYLLLVDEHDTVQFRRVQVGPLIEGDLRVVRDGVSGTEWVVVNGLQRARPGSVVKPKREAPASPPSPQATPGVAASASG